MDIGVLARTDGNAIKTTSKSVVTVTRDLTLAAGTQAVTGVGFKPKAVIFFSLVSGATGQASFGMSAAEGGGSQRAFGDRFRSVADTWASAGGLSINTLTGSGLNYNGAVTAYDTDGFTITWTKFGVSSGTLTVYALCLK